MGLRQVNIISEIQSQELTDGQLSQLEAILRRPEPVVEKSKTVMVQNVNTGKYTEEVSREYYEEMGPGFFAMDTWEEVK